MSIQQVNFVFKRDGERFTMTQAALADGTSCMSQKVASVMQSVLVNSAEYEKISKFPELRVSLFQSPQLSLRIQSSDYVLDITIKQLEPVAGEIFSCTKKLETVSAALYKLQGKDVELKTQHSINKLLCVIEKLINSDTPIVESVLDHILSQLTSPVDPSGLCEKLEKLFKEINLVLLHLTVQDLDRQLEAHEMDLIEATDALNGLQSFKLRDIKDLIQDIPNEELDKQLLKNSEQLQKQEARLAPQLTELAEIEEDCFRGWTVTELKTKISGFIFQHTTQPYFQELITVWDSVLKVKGLVEDLEKAHWWSKASIMAQITSYGPSLMKSLEAIAEKIPEKSFQKFIFLLSEFALTFLKEAFGEGVEQIIPPDRKSYLLSIVALLRKTTSTAKKEIERCKHTDEQLQVFKKISEDRRALQELYQRCPGATEEIQRLENTEYQLSGMTIKQFKNPKATGNNLFAEMFLALVQKFEKMKQQFEFTAFMYQNSIHKALMFNN